MLLNFAISQRKDGRWDVTALHGVDGDGVAMPRIGLGFDTFDAAAGWLSDHIRSYEQED